MVTRDNGYTFSDHENRETDVYAMAKYEWTIRALKRNQMGSPAKIGNVGCGAGTFTKLLESNNFNVYSTEPDANARARAIENCDPNKEIHPFGIFDLPKSEFFNVIVMHDVLEHIDREVEAIKTVADHLVPGGLFLLTVPAMPNLFGFHDVQLGHFRRYSKKSMSLALKRDFQILEMRYFGFFSIPIVWLFSKRLRRGYPSLESEGRSMVQRLYSQLCKAEGYIPLPRGTSLLVIAKLRD